MRHLHGAFEQTIFRQVARELQLFANGKRRSGPHANSRLTQVNHGAGDCPPASPELAVPLDDQPDGLPLVAHALTLLSLTKLSKDHAQQPHAMPLQWRGPRISLGSKEGAMARIDGVAPVALLTGFEPYGGRRVNPATEVVTRLDGAEIEGVRVAGRVLPVSFGALRSRIHELMQKVAPVVVVSLGLWPGEPTIRLERVALNLADFEIPDNDGALLRDDVVAAAAPTAIASTLPLRAIEGALLRAGIPARLSTTPGTFRCNTTMYTSLHTARAGRARRAVRLRPPTLPARTGGGAPPGPAQGAGARAAPARGPRVDEPRHDGGGGAHRPRRVARDGRLIPDGRGDPPARAGDEAIRSHARRRPALAHRPPRRVLHVPRAERLGQVDDPPHDRGPRAA